jgi:hypothetical protein
MNAYAEALNGVGIVNHIPLLIAPERVIWFRHVAWARCLGLRLRAICHSSGRGPKRLEIETWMMRTAGLRIGLSFPSNESLKKWQDSISTLVCVQLRRPHIVDILLEGVGVGLQLGFCTFLCSSNSCIDLCFDICSRDYHEAAGAVVEQLAQIL